MKDATDQWFGTYVTHIHSQKNKKQHIIFSCCLCDLDWNKDEQPANLSCRLWTDLHRTQIWWWHQTDPPGNVKWTEAASAPLHRADWPHQTPLREPAMINRCKKQLIQKHLKPHTKFKHVGVGAQSSSHIHIGFQFFRENPRSWFHAYKRVLDTDLPCNQTSRLGYSHLLSASKRHLQHLSVEHWQAEWCWDSISPSIHWRQREGMHLPWT